LDQKNEKEKTAQIALIDNKIQNVQNMHAILSNLTELFAGKSKKQQQNAFKVQKALNIASTLTETYLGAQKAYTSQIIIGDPTSVVRGALAAAVVVTAGLANVKKIASTTFDGGGGGGGGGSEGGGGGGGSSAPAAPQSAPNFNLVGATGLNQLDMLSIAPELFSCLTSSTTKGCIGFLTIEFFEISKSLFLFYEFSSLLFSIKVARLLAC
jgi:hypothetical protein